MVRKLYQKAGNPGWQKGVSGNPHGRPKGKLDSAKVRYREQDALKSMAEFVIDHDSEYSEPVQLLNAFARCPDVPAALRISAASAAAPYLQPKLLPVPGPQYVYDTIEVPDFESIEAAEAFMLRLSQRVGAAELEVQSANEIFARIRDWIHISRQGQELELKRLAADNTGAEQVIRIEGGLPDLPGTNIIMPSLEGPATDAEPILGIDRAAPAQDPDAALPSGADPATIHPGSAK